jgi:hypothetical protein
MNKKDQYFIGDMSRLCNISKKALRYYDEINLIPSQRDDCNNYRFYTDESLLAVPVIKYYKQMGFTLDSESFERYVTDYWTTNNKSKFVTEILIKASRKGRSSIL